jgi:hypothetical protein
MVSAAGLLAVRTRHAARSRGAVVSARGRDAAARGRTWGPRGATCPAESQRRPAPPTTSCIAGLAEEGIPRHGPVETGSPQLVHLVRVPPSGTWEQRRANRYALAEQWPGPNRPSTSLPRSSTSSGANLGRVRAGQPDRCRRAGPACPARSSKKRPPWPTPRPPTIPRRGPGASSSTWPEFCRSPTTASAAPVRFLPVWERQTCWSPRGGPGFLPEATYRPRIFSTNDTPLVSRPSWSDGAVAGNVGYEDGRVTLDPFGELPASASDERVDDEARTACSVARRGRTT